MIRKTDADETDLSSPLTKTKVTMLCYSPLLSWEMREKGLAEDSWGETALLSFHV